VSLRDYSTHLGRALEEVSLYPLPHLDDSDEENEDDSENESSGREIALDIARTTPSTHSSSSFSKDNGKKNAEGQDYLLGLDSQLEEEYTIKCIYVLRTFRLHLLHKSLSVFVQIST
jgi:hypothetical protein